MLYTPNPATAVATAMLAHGNYKFAVLDTPLGQGYTLNKTLRDTYNSAQGVLVRGEAYTEVDPNAVMPLGITYAAGQLLTDADFGPHMPFSNVPITGIESLDQAYLSDVETNAVNYELNNIVHFKRLVDGGFGPFGLRSLTNASPFGMYSVRRTWWYAYEQIQSIIRPLLHRRSLNADTFRDIDNAVGGFFEGIMEPRGMVVGAGGGPGTRGQGWDWKADGDTTPQSILDEGGLHAKLGMKVPRALNFVEIEVREFEAPAVTEVAPEVI
jgi:phage tail sheath protein FI